MNLYDLLDVDETASREEIRSAWRAATADLDPTDRRFRAFNDAASVLLDDEKRAAYDAELAAAREEAEPAEPVVSEPEADETTADAGAEPDPEPAGPPRWALVAAVAAAAVALALLVAVLVAPGTRAGESPSERADAAEEAARSAEAAVAELVPVVLAYDYRTFDDDVDRARAYLTDDYAAERDELFASTVEVGDEELTFREQVVKEKVVVAAAVTGTGLTRVSESGEVATVVAFIDQESRKGKAAPQPLKMWATLTLEREDGRWLLDDVCTEEDCF